MKETWFHILDDFKDYIGNGWFVWACFLAALVFCLVKGNDRRKRLFTFSAVAIVILFSFSGTGIFGAMNEGMTGDFDILIVKSFLDFFTAMIFATSLGISVASIFVPQTLVQVILAYSAVFIIPFVTPEMRGDFAAVGGMLMIAAGFRICNIQMFHVANMLPALFLAMPISHFWSSFF